MCRIWQIWPICIICMYTVLYTPSCHMQDIHPLPLICNNMHNMQNNMQNMHPLCFHNRKKSKYVNKKEILISNRAYTQRVGPVWDFTSVGKDCVCVGHIDTVGNILCQPSPSTLTARQSALFIVYVPNAVVTIMMFDAKKTSVSVRNILHRSIQQKTTKRFTAKLINSHPHAHRSTKCSASVGKRRWKESCDDVFENNGS